MDSFVTAQAVDDAAGADLGLTRINEFNRPGISGSFDRDPARRNAPPRNDGTTLAISYLFRPSIGVIASFSSSMPSMQLTFSAITSVPSGLVPCANTSTPQSLQS
jgi:hypothetical protein